MWKKGEVSGRGGNGRLHTRKIERKERDGRGKRKTVVRYSQDKVGKKGGEDLMEGEEMLKLSNMKN